MPADALQPVPFSFPAQALFPRRFEHQARPVLLQDDPAGLVAEERRRKIGRNRPFEARWGIDACPRGRCASRARGGASARGRPDPRRRSIRRARAVSPRCSCPKELCDGDDRPACRSGHGRGCFPRHRWPGSGRGNAGRVPSAVVDMDHKKPGDVKSGGPKLHYIKQLR